MIKAIKMKRCRALQHSAGGAVGFLVPTTAAGPVSGHVCGWLGNGATATPSPSWYGEAIRTENHLLLWISYKQFHDKGPDLIKYLVRSTDGCSLCL